MDHNLCDDESYGGNAQSGGMRDIPGEPSLDSVSGVAVRVH